MEKEKSGTGTANATLQAQMNELKTKLEGAQKNAETQRAANRELEVYILLYTFTHSLVNGMNMFVSKVYTKYKHFQGGL